MYKNTTINALNFTLSVLNRLIIANTLYFLFGAFSLGILYSIIAFNGAAVLICSIYELQLSKGMRLIDRKAYSTIFLNVFIVSICIILYFQIQIYFLCPLILFYLALNCNLILSGYLFNQKYYYQYRKISIFAEILEVMLFLITLYFFNNPYVSVVASLILKNVCLLLLSLNFAISKNVFSSYRSHYKMSNRPELQDYSSHGDVVGNFLLISVFPLILSQVFGTATLGHFSFFKQFYSLGNMIQTALFRGIWQDYVLSERVITIIEAFSKISVAVPFLVLVTGVFFALEDLRLLFVGCGSMYIITTWARNKILVNGHIKRTVQFNHEISFFISFSLVTLLSVSIYDLELGQVLIICSLCSLFVTWAINLIFVQS